ncbi:MAG: ABC transporter ATP-binding protein/permease [Actinomycetia bacterium]|nr:ABC transporter ATP-binding protein/permease [Actinomycetes bacterium]
MIPVRAYFTLFTGYLRPHRRTGVLLAAIMLATIALQLANPQLIRIFIDEAIAGTAVGSLVPLAIAFMVIAVLHQLLMVWATYLAEQIGWSATNQLRADLTDHVLHLDMGFHKSTSPGALIERIDGDVTALSNFFSSMIIKIIGNGVLLVGILVLLWIESWIVGLSITTLILVTFLGLFRLHGVTVPWQKDIRATSAEMYGFIGEQIDGTEDVEANGATGYMLSRFDDIQRRWLPQVVLGWTGWALMWVSSMALYFASLMVAYLLGSWLFGVGTLTIGSVYIVFQYIEMAHRPIEQIREELIDLQKAGASIDRVQELMDTRTRLVQRSNATLAMGPLDVTFQDVTFTYDDEAGDEIVLDDVSFVIPSGRVVGLLGRTGSGKSTIARLITRLHEPQVGSVSVGGRATWDVDMTDLRRRVAMVTQDVQLFRATIRENLTFFDPDVPDDRLFEAIERLELDSWLATLPDGLDTVLDSGSGGLSAGQAQLLAFTRVFLRDPGVVVLDEASSRLDPATEALLERAVDHLLEDRTAILIAHRLETITRADDIIILDEGRIIEQGQRTRLAGDPNSKFSKLLATGMEEVLA